MTNQTDEQLNNVVVALRRLAPKRALTYAEGLNVAKLQARRARMLLNMSAPSADLRWILHLPGVQVEALPAYEVREIAKAEASGLTKRLRGGGYFIAVNKNASHSHRRFTLAHELKHLLDYPYMKTLYVRLGHGDKELHDRQIERIADMFAAHFLMPSTLLKQVWFGQLQDPTALAGLFTVSEEAMRIRLRNEGLLDDDQRPTETLFRRVGVLLELEHVNPAA
jgi:Zn-dependent peptidase ImmA (M78 family)